MADGAIEYQRLVVRVVADTSEVTADLKKFNSSLLKLDKISKELDFKHIKEVQELLQGIANIDFSNVSKGLQDVVRAFNAFNSKTFRKATKNGTQLEGAYPLGAGIETTTTDISNLNFENTGITTFVSELEKATQLTGELETELNFVTGQSFENDLENQLKGIGLNAKQMQVIFGELNRDLDSDVFSSEQFEAVRKILEDLGIDGERLVSVMSNLKTEVEETENPFSAMGFNGRQVAEIMKAINYESNKFSADDIKKLENGLRELGYSEEEIKKITSQLSQEMKKMGDGANKGSNGLKKLLTQFTRIMRYRIIRKIIQEIYKALTEGIKAIAEFDSGVNDSLSKIMSAFTYLKNSIGALFAPLIQIVEPILSELVMLVGDLGNTFAEFYASVNGQDTFSKAKYELEDYQKALKKTTTLGIDELNIVGDDKKNALFTTEQVDLGKEETSLAKTLRDVFGEIKDIIGKVIEVFKDLVQKILPAISKLLQPIMKIIGFIIDLIEQLVDETFKDVHESLVSFVEMIGNIFNFIAQIVQDLMPQLQQVIAIVSTILNLINNSLSGTFNLIGRIFEIITPIVAVLNLFVMPVLNAIMAVVTTIVKALEGVVKTITMIFTTNPLDWGDKFKSIWGDIGSDIGRAWNNMVSGTEAQFSNFSTTYLGAEASNVSSIETSTPAQANQNIVINLDGQQIASVVTNRQNNFGQDLVVGGNVNWGK